MFIRTFKARKRFLDTLAEGYSVSSAAKTAGGTPGNFRAWRRADPNFAADWDEAIEEGTDHLEDVATDRAVEKSDTLMVMMLKARRPDKFDRGSKLEVSGGISVEGSKAKLLNRLARLQAQGALPAPSPTTSGEILELNATDITPVREPTNRGRKRREAGVGAQG
jgi:hypothetical protein